MSKNTFTVTVDLKAFFANHKSKVKLFINENIKIISDLENKITEIFGIQKYHLMCNEFLLPSCEDIRVLANGDTVRAVPNEDGEEIKLLDETYYKKKEMANHLKKKKKPISAVVAETPIILEKKVKIKKSETSSPQRESVPEPVKIKTPTKPVKEIPTVTREKLKSKDKTVSWSTNPLRKTINHVKIAKIPVKKIDTSLSEFLFQPITSTPDPIQKPNEYHAFASVSGEKMQVSETINEYPITKKENPTFSTLPIQNNIVEAAPTSTKKETDLKNWKHNILAKFTHHLQASKQTIQDMDQNKISSTNKERDEFVNDSSTNSVTSKLTKLNPDSCQIQKKNPWRQVSGVGYYLKLMDKVGWDPTKSILNVDPNASTEVNKVEIEVEDQNSNTMNGDSMSDYSSVALAKRKRKRKHKKRPRVATPIPRISTPIPMKYSEELSPISTPNHIRFEEVKELVSGQGTPVVIEDLEEARPEENVKILQNLSLNTQLECRPSKPNDLIDEAGISEYLQRPDMELIALYDLLID